MSYQPGRYTIQGSYQRGRSLTASTGTLGSDGSLGAGTIKDTSGSLATSSTNSAKVLVQDDGGNTLLSATSMSYVSAGRWDYVLPVTGITDGGRNLVIWIKIYASDGTTQVWQQDFFYQDAMA